MVAVTHQILLTLAATAMALPAEMSLNIEARAPQFSIPGGSLGGSSTSNDVTSGVCKPVTYIFARGTTETGNMGTTVGPALQQKLEQALGAGQVATQGVNYPADFAGALRGSISPKTASGSTNCAFLVKQALSKCPDTKIVLAGYSQGAQQVHGCLMNLGSTEAAKVAVSASPRRSVEMSKRVGFLSITSLHHHFALP